MSNIIHKELPDRALGAAFTIHRALGPGLLEKAYEGAMSIELSRRGLAVEHHVPYPLF